MVSVWKSLVMDIRSYAKSCQELENSDKLSEEEGNVIFNDAVSTFYFCLCGVRHMVKDHSYSKRGNMQVPLHGYSFWLATRVLLYVPSHRKDSSYHRALAWTEIAQWVHHARLIWQRITPWVDSTTQLHLIPISCQSPSGQITVNQQSDEDFRVCQPQDKENFNYSSSQFCSYCFMKKEKIILVCPEGKETSQTI